MNKPIKGIWELRKDIEHATGNNTVIYSEYPLVGRGSVIHNAISHQEVEKEFCKALKLSIKQRLYCWICKVLHG